MVCRFCPRHKRGYSWENALLMSDSCHTTRTCCACERCFLKTSKMLQQYLFHRLKNLCKGPLFSQTVRRIITRFEKTGNFGSSQLWGCRSTYPFVVEDVTTLVIEQSMDNVASYSSACAVSQHLDASYSTLWNVLREIVHFYLHKIRYNQQLLPHWQEEKAYLCIDISG